MQEVNIIGNSIICSDNVRKQNFQLSFIRNIIYLYVHYYILLYINRNFIFKKKCVKRKYQHVKLKFIHFLRLYVN